MKTIHGLKKRLFLTHVIEFKLFNLHIVNSSDILKVVTLLFEERSNAVLFMFTGVINDSYGDE